MHEVRWKREDQEHGGGAEREAQEAVRAPWVKGPQVMVHLKHVLARKEAYKKKKNIHTIA